MSVKWYAMDYLGMTYFRAPKEFGYNKSFHVHNPKNIFPHMFMFMNEKDDGCGCRYELENDTYGRFLTHSHDWNDFTDITEDVYKEYIEFWDKINK